MSSAELKPRRFDRDVDGIVLLDKPTGMTSNAALQKVRALFRANKAGHAGSLDPMASGMLPICFGQATKVCAFLLDERKSYRFTVQLGERTDTGDADGAIIETAAVPSLTETFVRTVLQRNLGEQQQIPPMYSALKFQGERLYELARRGEEVERKPRRIIIESLDFVSLGDRDLAVEVRCSKGTYVRVLAEDIAKQLGTIGHLIKLRRLQVDPFDNALMCSLEQLQELAVHGLAALDAKLIAADQALPHLAQAKFDDCGQAALLHGQSALPTAPLNATGWVRMYGPGGVFIGLGEAVAGDSIQPRRILRNLPITFTLTE